ncbi:MAG: carbamoyl-phosphate synthase large subunit, partial [Candidatus Margulisiibacteriota bacterium]|nr:carbamoyl-phosphate synthase large subunit [Candidatus Margulisiibacteriota bacterium]
MPRRNDIKTILLIGSGPIIIGQACEFDYSGTQACKALREDGYRVVLINSNPATIMTDPSTADATYVEPLTVEMLEKVIQKEKPCAILPTLGGQTGLNLAMEASKQGVLAKYNVELIGATEEVIDKAEDRDKFKAAMEKIGCNVPQSKSANTIDKAVEVAKEIGFPCVIRPAFTLGGTGGGIAYNMEEVEQISKAGIDNSLISEVLIEKSILGWKEYELEVMRDKNDNVVIVCAIENFDPMGVHTGDSITVAPAQTLTDAQYQDLRNQSKKIIREIGVETGGSNIQFSVNPENGDTIVIEMNPRVSRSSALASKATGFPIAKLAAKLAVGYTLDELKNDITTTTPASFEPTLDYCVVKIPRFNFDKFPASKPHLGVSMKSVGEVMSIGRTFKEAFQKACRSLEVKRFGFGLDGKDNLNLTESELEKLLVTPTPNRLFALPTAIRKGFSVEKIFELSKIDPWFLKQLVDLVNESNEFSFDADSIRRAKELGYSDIQLSQLLGKSDKEIYDFRLQNNIVPTYKIVDTCAGEFEAKTPYYYSSYETYDEVRDSDTKKVMILGGGPNRIGQGIEFDYCCVHASMAIRDLGFESIMVNSNPETVSTDFDTSDRLYFEPLTVEDVCHIYNREKPEGVIVQFGGQTPLNLAKELESRGVNILGTSQDSIDIAEDRDRFQQIISELNLHQPANGIVHSVDNAHAVANNVGYPVLVRPSYVLGGAAMKIVYSDKELDDYIKNAFVEYKDNSLLIDKFLDDAIEIDVDALSDGNDCVVAGIMQHIEEAGIHSGDSASVLPAFSLSNSMLSEIKEATYKIAKRLNVIGLLNIQYAIQNETLYVLEVNPRASRTVPFVSKATGIQWAKLATQVMLGSKIKSLNVKEVVPTHISVKESVFPFKRFPGVDTLLGPEMRSTGEVMGISKTVGAAYLKSQMAAGQVIPAEGTIYISVKDSDKPKILPIAQLIKDMGFDIVATKGTAEFLNDNNIDVTSIFKVNEGRPNILDALKNNDIQMVINTPSSGESRFDDKIIRQESYKLNVPVIT